MENTHTSESSGYSVSPDELNPQLTSLNEAFQASSGLEETVVPTPSESVIAPEQSIPTRESDGPELVSNPNKIIATAEYDAPDTKIIDQLEHATTHAEIGNAKKEALKLGYLVSVAITNPNSGKTEWRVVPKGDEGNAITAVARDASARVRAAEMADRDESHSSATAVRPEDNTNQINAEVISTNVNLLDQQPAPIDPAAPDIITKSAEPNNAGINIVPASTEEPGFETVNIQTSDALTLEPKSADVPMPSVEAQPIATTPDKTLSHEEKVTNLLALAAQERDKAASASASSYIEILREQGETLGLIEKASEGFVSLNPNGEKLLLMLNLLVDEQQHFGPEIVPLPEAEAKKPEIVRGTVKIPATEPETKPEPKVPVRRRPVPKPTTEPGPAKEPTLTPEQIATRAEAVRAFEERRASLERAKVAAQTEMMTDRLLGNLKSLDPKLVLSGVGPNGEPMSIDDRLRSAREAIAVLQAKERHGMIFRNVDRQQFEAVDGSYRDLVKLRMVEMIKAEIAGGKSEAEIRLATIDLLTSEAHEMSKAEIAAAEKRPGAKLQKFLQGHKKTRIAIGLSLTAVGVVSTAAGILPLAGVALGGRALLSGATTYYGAKRALNVSSALGSRKVGSRKRLNDESYDALLKTSYYQKISGLLSSDTLNTEATKKMKQGDQAELVRLEAYERERLDWKLYRESNLKGKNVVEITMGILAERRSADTAQLEKDRRGNIKRTIGALVIAGAASALTIHVGMDRLAGARPKLSDVGRPTPAVPEPGVGGVAKVAEKAAQVSVENGPSQYVDMHQVVPGESIWKISHNYLLRYDSDWSKLSPQDQLIKTDRLKDLILKQQHAKSLLMPGQQIKMPWSAVKDAINYKQ